jgi:hypothetical protein
MSTCRIFGFVLKLNAAFFACFLMLNSAFGQTPGKVEVIKDPQIDSLIAKRLSLNNSRTLATSAGFQIQLYLGPDKQDAYDAQSRFKSLYPGTNTYLSYTEPNYKVQVGDFRSRMEAQKLMNELKQYFPTVLIIPATINQPQR